jgi:hypothetical protein
MPIGAPDVLVPAVLLHLVTERTPGAPLMVFLFLRLPSDQGQGVGRLTNPGAAWIIWIFADSIADPASDRHLHTGDSDRLAQVKDIAGAVCAMAGRTVECRVSRV